MIAALSGICFGIAAPPRPLGWLAWLGFAPILLLLRRPGQSLKRAFLIGWVGGLGVGLLGFPWIAELLQRFAGVPRPLSIAGMFVYSAWLAVPYGLWALLVQWGPQGGWLSWLWTLLTFPAIATAWPVVFPYTPLIGLVQHPEWIQGAELGGVPFVEFQAIAIGLLLAEALRRPQQHVQAATYAGVALALFGGSTLVGHLRMGQIERAASAAPSVTFGVVQPNLPVLWEDPNVAMQRLREPSRDIEADGAQIIVWPEAGTYPFLLPRPVREDPSDPRGEVLLLHRTPTLFGAVTMPPDGDRTYNSFIQLDAEGRVAAWFDKVMLVPFGEDIPLIDPRVLRSLVPTVSQLARGDGAARFLVEPRAVDDRIRETQPGGRTEPLPAAPKVAVGPMICAEDIHAGFARQVAAQAGGIDVFVNATIDAWYGVRQEPWEHLALAQFRTVEHRVPLVRSVSTGVSAVVAASGRIVASLPARDMNADNIASIPPETLVEKVALARNTAASPTWFARAGWLLPVVCRVLSALIASFWAAVLLRRRRDPHLSSQRLVA